MEYVVTCVKYLFKDHVVLQFSVLNTIDDQRLQDVRVDVDISDPDAYIIQSVVTAPLARYGTYRSMYVSTYAPAYILNLILLHYTTFYYITLHFIILYYSVVYYNVLYCNILYCIVLYCSKSYCIVLYCIVVNHIVLYYI